MAFTLTVAAEKTAPFHPGNRGRAASELAECGPIKFTTE